MAARKQTLKDLLANRTTNVEELTEDCVGDITPPHSDISSLSPPHSDNSLPPSPDVYATQIKEESDDESMGVTRGMLDHTKMALCMFMFSVLVFNPFKFVLNKYSVSGTEYSSVVEGRTILNVDGE